MVESSAKGIRTCILTHNRCSATSDEIVNTFPTPWGDQKQSGVHAHLLCRSKLNTYTQCERDDVVTANGPIHLKGYAFQIKAFGQHAPCEWVLRPNKNGWQKRPSICFAPNKSPMDSDVNSDLSTGLWQGFHDWMFRDAFQSPSYFCYDGYARGIYHTISQAANDWIDSTANVDEYLQVKLRFLFSDIRRFTHFAMRGAQFLEALHPKAELFENKRTRANAWEIVAGMHQWLRQVHLHAALYRFWKERNTAAAGSNRPEQALVEALEVGRAPARRRGSDFADIDLLKFALMTHTKFVPGSVFKTADMRSWIEGKFKRLHKDLSSKVQEAAEGLEGSGLLFRAENQKQPGRKVKWYKKIMYADLTDPAMQEANRLELQRYDFEN